MKLPHSLWALAEHRADLLRRIYVLRRRSSIGANNGAGVHELTRSLVRLDALLGPSRKRVLRAAGSIYRASRPRPRHGA